LAIKNKNILITAGPTWVHIDSVRVISNIATGETGTLLAKKLSAAGAKVTLLLGPVGVCCLNKKIRLIRFKFFDELRKKVIRELSSKKYDVIIHNAAVSDFKPSRFKGKISSGKPQALKLKPLPKIIRDIRRLSRKSKVVIFKFEPGVCDSVLIKKARRARLEAGADFIVANRISPYRAIIIDKEGVLAIAKTKMDLVNKLITKI